jgi:archaemetzincin
VTKRAARSPREIRVRKTGGESIGNRNDSIVTRSSRQITLTVIGLVADDVVEAVVPILEGVFEAAVELTAPVPLPRSAYDASREQHLSTRLLDALAQEKQPDWDRFLGITDVDLYVPDLNFVFGEADAQRGVAVFSLARLHTPDRGRFVHRAATEAIHELGHTYGLSHCADDHCVMWFSNTLAETDRKSTQLCATHTRELQRMIARSL